MLAWLLAFLPTGTGGCYVCCVVVGLFHASGDPPPPIAAGGRARGKARRARVPLLTPTAPVATFLGQRDAPPHPGADVPQSGGDPEESACG